MSGCGWTRWLGWIALVLAASPAAGAQAKPSSVAFSVATSPNAVRVDTTYLPTQAAITHVALTDADAAMDGVPGFPKLPYVVKLVALPPAARDVTVTVQPGTTTPVATGVVVEWAQLAQAGDNIADAPTYWPAPDAQDLDPSVATLPRWPADDAVLLGVEEGPGYRVARVRVNPIHLEPATGTVTLTPSIDVTVHWNKGRPTKAPKTVAGWSAARLLQQAVVNPSSVTIPLQPPALRPTQWPYVVVTDDKLWQAKPPSPGASRPGIVTEFERLADWQTARGLTARVVTVTDIVHGTYGNFARGAADLQEVIRRFLQWANRHWATQWVLLGGDVDIVPDRKVLGFGGNCPSAYWDAGIATPVAGRVGWHAASSTLRLQHAAVVTPSTTLVGMMSGRAFTRVTAPSATNPGWAYVTDATYATESSAQTNFIVLRGPTADVGPMSVNAVLNENSIPADAYYSALLPGPDGTHDWDTNGNGIYGQDGFSGTMDGVSIWPIVMVGRAPVETSAEAKAFVDKTLAYERYEGMPAGFVHKVLLTSTNWGGGPGVVPNTNNAILEDGEYQHVVASTSAVLRFASAPGGPGADWRLLAQEVGGPTVVPLNLFPIVPSTRSFFWCSDSGCSSPSISTSLTSFLAPLPTRFALVSGPAGELDPSAFVFDQVGPDYSVTEKEDIRGILALRFPSLDPPNRLYEDLFDAPGYPAADLAAITQPAVKAALDTGNNVASLAGHGWWGGCCGLDYRDVPALTNGNAGGLVFAESCLTAQFDVEDSVAELMVRTPTGGSAAYIGYSRYSWIGSSSLLEQKFWRAAALAPRLGQAVAVARVLHQTDLIERWSSAAITLMGDPALTLWRSEPLHITTIIPTNVPARKALVVQVVQAPPVALQVTVTGPHHFHRTLVLDKNGSATFKLRTKPGDTLRVVVTGDDVVPVDVQVPVV